MSNIREVELIFLLLLLFIIAFGQLARRIGTPYPIVMIVGGLLLGLIPGIPKITLDPDLIFLVVLPPLIYASAWTTSWRDFRFNIASIVSLAFGLVVFTVAGVAFFGPRLLGGFDWRLAMVLGAVVAPTDAIAASAIARRIGLPANIVDILEGESLINDATGLLALEFALGIVVSGHIPTIGEGALTFAWLIVGGVSLGLLLALLVYFVERAIDDGPIEIAISILTPYAAYFIADTVHASGILAVVACGLFLTRRSTRMFSPSARLQLTSFWQSFIYVLNGLVFVLIGLQLPFILAAIRGYSHMEVLRDGVLFSLMLIGLRLAWVFPSSWLAGLVHCRIHRTSERPVTRRAAFVIGWTGMRGVVSLAAALSLPTLLENGNAFPQRDLIVFLTFTVILVTLVLQGLTLTPLVRLLGLGGGNGPDCEELEARRIVIEAALAHLQSAREDRAEIADNIVDDIAGHYRHRLANLSSDEQDQEHRSHHESFVELTREAAQIERQTVIRLRDEGRINDNVMRRIERELDLAESGFADETGE